MVNHQMVNHVEVEPSNWWFTFHTKWTINLMVNHQNEPSMVNHQHWWLTINGWWLTKWFNHFLNHQPSMVDGSPWWWTINHWWLTIKKMVNHLREPSIKWLTIKLMVHHKTLEPSIWWLTIKLMVQPSKAWTINWWLTVNWWFNHQMVEPSIDC